MVIGRTLLKKILKYKLIGFKMLKIWIFKLISPMWNTNPLVIWLSHNHNEYPIYKDKYVVIWVYIVNIHNKYNKCIAVIWLVYSCQGQILFNDLFCLSNYFRSYGETNRDLIDMGLFGGRYPVCIKQTNSLKKPLKKVSFISSCW